MASEKRQRKKENRRAKIEEELRAYKARKRRRSSILIFALILVVGALATQAFKKEPKKATTSAAECPTKEPAMTIDPAKHYQATVDTSEGPIVVDIDAKRAPKTVNSVVALARCGFYDGTIFHRVVKDFVIQGGDPEGTGNGGPKYKVVEPPPADLKHTVGTVAMAKLPAEQAGTSGSQFFIVSGTSNPDLPAEYALLGKVASGQEVVDKIRQVPVGANDRPVNPPKINKINVAEVAGASSPAPGGPSPSPPANPTPSSPTKP